MSLERSNTITEFGGLFEVEIFRSGQHVLAQLLQKLRQLFFGDDPLGVGEEVGEHLEDLGLDGHQLPGPPQLVGGHVHLVVAEDHPCHRLIIPDAGGAGRFRT